MFNNLRKKNKNVGAFELSKIADICVRSVKNIIYNKTVLINCGFLLLSYFSIESGDACQQQFPLSHTFVDFVGF